jgi:hypothetical protein
MNIRYLIPRLVRHFLPQKLVRFLLQRSIIIRPGLETSDPRAAVNQYMKVLSEHGIALDGKMVLVFGYGGRFAVGIELLLLGAEHVILCDKYALPDDQQNLKLLPTQGKYLMLQDGHVYPSPTFITLIEADIRDPDVFQKIPPVDIVVSTSVYEHLDDVDGITRALAALTKLDGVQLHFIDLRDHFFKYPFEMLTYSEKVWKKWLNPTSNLNRYRLSDYQRIFQVYFDSLYISTLDRNQEAFLTTKPRIHPEFLMGDPDIDSVTLLQVLARSPRSAVGSL